MSTYTCKINTTKKYVRAPSPEHAALVMAHWYQIETGIASLGRTRVNVGGAEYEVQLSSSYVEKV